MSREGRSWQRVSAWLAGLVSCLVVAIATAQVAVPDPEQDPRLRTPITLAEPAISLGELCTTLTRQTKVRLSVSSGWRETRVVAYVPNRPLHELMANLPKVAPQLEWQVFRTSEGRFTYHLRATRPDPPLPAPTTEAEIVRRARAFVETLRKALREPDKKLIAQVKRFAQLQNELGSTPGDKAPALRRELASLEPYLVAAIYKGLIEPETYMPVEQEAIQWAVPLLLSLQANEWSLLQWGGQITVSASQHPAYPRRWVAQYRAQEIRAAKEAIESAEDEEARAYALEHKAHMEQITDVWVCAYVDDRLTVALRPVVGGELGGSIYEKVFEVARYAVPNEPKEILLERYGALPEFEIPDEPIFRQPFPETPDWIRKKANWYNELG
ncbi:MAG: hypothetical protein NZL85_08930, partial [Fimbriimonadales bacterium]|nr:hypothetical protein [Fimbriimonadales bacterium]